MVEVKANGGPKPLADIKLKPISDADSGSEQVKTPDETKSGSQATTKNTEVAPGESQ